MAAAQSVPAQGQQFRIAVAPVMDRSQGDPDTSLSMQLPLINLHSPEDITATDITLAIRDMLVTDLFVSGQFIVLEREQMDALALERQFDANQFDLSADPQLEGAELVLVSALTAFDPGIGGAALPVPILLGHNASFGLARLGLKRGYAALDMRVVEVSTGRVLRSVAVEGRNSRFGFDFDLFVDAGSAYVALPGALKWFRNTPIERALQEMVSEAVRELARDALSGSHNAPSAVGEHRGE